VIGVGNFCVRGRRLLIRYLFVRGRSSNFRGARDEEDLI
jgi:hypothetical protein